MGAGALSEYDPLLFGRNTEEGLVAIEPGDAVGHPDEMVLFVRSGERMVQHTEPFEPFLVADEQALAGCPVSHTLTPMRGGRPLNVKASFASWKDFLRARTWLSSATGRSPSSREAPYYAVNDPVQQHLLTTGRTQFMGMTFEQVRRMQVDIECYTSPGYEFCHAGRAGDRIIAISVGLPDGTNVVLSAPELSEKEMLEAFVALVVEHDPDVIEGHNIFNFDLPYITERARRHKVKLRLGRNGKPPSHRPSRLSIGDRVMTYERFDVHGRHVIDTLFLAQMYDLTNRSLSGFGLKEIAVHFGFARSDRTYIEGREISRVFEEDPARLCRYASDDIDETRALASLLSVSWFVQAQLLPFSYQNVCVRGNAMKIDALLIREYLRQGESLPLPEEPRAFAGGYTDIFKEGIIRNVHHCDIRSLYPSLMLTRKLAPRADRLGAFLSLLAALKDYRLRAKARMKACTSKAEATYHDARQATFKILINSFYGYLGFAQGRFNDFSAAEEVTAAGRALLRSMIDWLLEHRAQPVEIDTDGIYFVPPAEIPAAELGPFRDAFAASLPEGIDIEFDGEYESMYSYKMKNYALLTRDGEMIIKGAALKSRGLESFQRSFLERFIRLKLEDRAEEIPALKDEYEGAIRNHKWPVDVLAKTETLQDSPAAYQAKRDKGKGARRAAYELALASGREYRAGDQVSYYVTGDRKSVSVHENSKLVSDWDHDENVAYYLAKLDALYRKFVEAPQQGELALS